MYVLMNSSLADQGDLVNRAFTNHLVLLVSFCDLYALST